MGLMSLLPLFEQKKSFFMMCAWYQDMHLRICALSNHDNKTTIYTSVCITDNPYVSDQH